MDVKEESLKLHKEKQGAIEVVGTLPLLNGNDIYTRSGWSLFGNS